MEGNNDSKFWKEFAEQQNALNNQDTESEVEKEVDIKEWIDRCINGVGGLISYEKHEWAIRLESDEIVSASWIIRCLANPSCEGSEEVLQAIIERRKEVAEQQRA